MKRCPTVPVAPRTATLRLRIPSKFDVSGGRRGEPPVPVVDPAKEPETGGGEVGEHLVVAHDVAALDANAPVAMGPGVVIDGLEEQMALSRDIRDANGHGAEMTLAGHRVVPDVWVVALDQSDAVRREVAPHRPQEREPDLFGCVDERAHQKDSSERAPELQILDPRKHGLG